MKRAGIALAIGLAAAIASAEQPVLRYVPKHEELKYTFGGVAPVARIKPGTRIVSWTEDCYDGAVTNPGQTPSKVQLPGHDNPQTGPFYVEGAEPGDTLAIRIEKLEPARDHGISSSFPGFGALNSTDRTALLHADLPETVWFYAVDRAKKVLRTKSQDGKFSWEVPLAPFLGCLGVSPAHGEARSTIVPDSFGGNMDCPEVRAGNTVYLGVRVPGALVSFGDGHLGMGDGEIIGTAVEGAMNVELTVDLIKGRETPWPRIENAEWMMSVGAGRPLEDAARIAFKDMVQWVREKSGLSEMDAYQFVSQSARSPIVQIVDPNYTVLVKIEKSRLPKEQSTSFEKPTSVPERSDHHAKVDERGDHVMGFDHSKTTHHFLLSAAGGSIEVAANDPKDSESRNSIRAHLEHIAGMFAEGDFEAPMLIHDRVPPGVPTMKDRKSQIEWKFEETPDGGRVRVMTKDAKALAAIHEFLRFQIEDHRTGDPTEVSPGTPR